MAKVSLLSKTDEKAMEDKAIANIIIFSNGVLEIKPINSDISKAAKYCYLQDFVNAFNDVSVKTGLVPPGTIGYSEVANEQHLLFCLPPHSRPITFKPGEKSVDYNINLPYSIWSFVISHGFIQVFRTKIFLAERLPLKEEHCFSFPLGNVFDRLEICWGTTFTTNEAIKKFTMWEAISVTDRFFASVFNGHLDINAATNIQFLRDNSFAAFVKRHGDKYRLTKNMYHEVMRLYEK